MAQIVLKKNYQLIKVQDKSAYVTRSVTYSKIDKDTFIQRAADNSGIDRGQITLVTDAFLPRWKSAAFFVFFCHLYIAIQTKIRNFVAAYSCCRLRQQVSHEVMESFFRTHKYLVEHLQAPVRRTLMDEINWNDRMIGIKGARGVGKTTFLLQYAKEHFPPDDHSCLYINTNNFYVQNVGFSEFAGEFYHEGGRVLLIDQVFKQPDWSRQLRECYERYLGLKIVFTGSSVMRLKTENPELGGIVKSYNLRGFSFREYLNLKAGTDFPAYTLEDIIGHHQDIARGILSVVRPRDYFKDYLHHGYYPFFLEKQNYSENLLKTMNMMIEVDVLLIKQIELKYLAKIKKLFYLLTMSGSTVPNVSQLAKELVMSRATVMHYIKYLTEARLVNMIYARGEEFPKKPARVLLHNSNLMYSFYPKRFDDHDVQEAFFCNTIWKDHQVNKVGNIGSFLIDNRHEFRIIEHLTHLKSKSKCLFAVNQCDMGEGNQIPLWLFGFLY